MPLSRSFSAKVALDAIRLDKTLADLAETPKMGIEALYRKPNMSRKHAKNTCPQLSPSLPTAAPPYRGDRW